MDFLTAYSCEEFLDNVFYFFTLQVHRVNPAYAQTSLNHFFLEFAKNL